jgi:hypothetical protein
MTEGILGLHLCGVHKTPAVSPHQEVLQMQYKSYVESRHIGTCGQASLIIASRELHDS